MAGLTFNREHVFKIMEQNDCPYWELWATDLLKAAISQNEDIDVEESINILKDTLKGIEGSTIRIRICNNPFPLSPGQPKGQKLFDFNIKLRNAFESNNNQERGVGNVHASGDRQMIYDLMQKMYDLNTKLVEQQNNHSVELLKRDMQNMKESLESKHPLQGFIKNLEPYSPLILQNMTGMNLGVTQTGAVTHAIAGTETPEETQRKKNILLSALNELKQIDVSMEENIANIAKVAKSNPQQYLMYMQMVKTQADIIK